jgi:hypothetical protein
MVLVVGWACGVPVGHWGKGYLAMDAPRKIRGFLAGIFKETEIIRCVLIRKGYKLLPKDRELCLEKHIALVGYHAFHSQTPFPSLFS